MWSARLGLLLFSPIFAVLLAEACLRLAGYGYPVGFFVRSSTGAEFITNQKFAWQFFSSRTSTKPFLFTLSPKKAPETLRICVLGDSAAMGTPDPAFSFARIMDAMLRRQYPGTRFEFMNAAMRGINSYVTRRIAQECARHEVDVFIIYMGNNEVVGLHAPHAGSPAWTHSLTLLRTGESVRRTKLGQWLSARLISGPEGHEQDMAYFRSHCLPAEDPLRDETRENFQANLEDILRAARASGAKVILSTVGVNLRDCPPLSSAHRPKISNAERTQWETIEKEGEELERSGRVGQAIPKYLEAAKIDDHFAELHYRLGRCYSGIQDWTNAQRQFVLARDWDALQFRTDSRMNEIIHQTAAAHRQDGVVLVDSEHNFAASDLSEHEVPGERLFYEHVHPTFAGNYLLAKDCSDALTSLLKERLAPAPAGPMPTLQQCAEDIAYTPYDDANVTAAMVRLTSGPPFLDQLDHAQRQAAAEASSKAQLAAFGPAEAQRSLDSYLAALQKRPDDWPIHFNLALFCQELKRTQQATEQFGYLVKRFPEVKNFRIGLANALESQGDKKAAMEQLRCAMVLDTEDRGLQQRLQKLRGADAAP